MSDLLEKAKQIIAKGKALQDPDLIQMGMDLLEEMGPPPDNESPSYYKCKNCGHTMPVDKERKRCPKCNKHKLSIVTPPAPSDVAPPPTPDNNSFYHEIRSKQQERTYYDDEGNPVGRYTKTEQFEPKTFTNVFNDDKTEFVDDPVNEKLKAITKVNPRTRKSTNLVSVKCDGCGKEDQVHPIHMASSSRYLCNKCAGRRSQR
jgi:predicted Zn-ribbon and HTH transcriptional regulator